MIRVKIDFEGSVSRFACRLDVDEKEREESKWTPGLTVLSFSEMDICVSTCIIYVFLSCHWI